MVFEIEDIIEKIFTDAGIFLLALLIFPPGEAHMRSGGCFSSPVRLSDEGVGAFLTSPEAIVSLYPSWGAKW